mmetsp:Transcript_7037/g.15302  ORF Transcript_7037/g.15302 Transcript_7037/m.15302 type:complete len:635 (+) Transcript_7037:405-2309(+)|eukprot:CAMPEP_0172528892 /NCGR_PEP_ID=MMETSP1067-20121228/3116_1 /TAXON_ID=265564 ORGANISM="Thalassiosira punctigera, Strain Tpunct2005C2" /NCGR_SAMPLE_ID=MMETSP1067 /ASSEMBLY_ACC=CAM_ASM_000444 /LENGTH=634 /DNA_ID=CAMNT_0013312867 /DNA_START=384 /DNA_END=2288 /DNA_ORIENTATION=+
MFMSSTTYQTCLASLTSAGNNGDGASSSPSAEALLQCVSDSFDSAQDNSNSSIDAFFLLYAASLVFFMQSGFAMICAGCVRINNVQNTLLKNLLDACGASLGFYTVGYAFAFGGSFVGDGRTTFIGTENFFLMGVEKDSFWLFQFAFCATSATIVAGTLAERCQMTAYLAYSIMLAAFVYPVVVHSIWSPQGFLSAHNPSPLWGSGMVDFAGSSVVHLTGGTTALIATKILGPRAGRFYDLRGRPLEDGPREMPGHSLALQCLGTFILWFGWYGFNTGSIISLTLDDHHLVVSHTAINTTLSAAAGCVMTLFLSTIVAEHFTGEVTFNLQYAMNGCLSGLVAITAGCSVVESWASIIIGLVSGALYLGCSKFLIRKRIDDAVDAIPVHMINGIWGSLSVGLFAEPSLMEKVYKTSAHVGWFYSWGQGSADAILLACQVVGILFVIGWVVFTMTPFFWLLHYCGFLRADSLEEVVGLDVGYHGGMLRKHSNVHNSELDDKEMEEYLQEYECRKRERAYFKKERSRSIPASSIHQDSLHGNSYHGKRIITSNMIESLDATAGKGASENNNNDPENTSDALGSNGDTLDTNNDNLENINNTFATSNDMSVDNCRGSEEGSPQSRSNFSDTERTMEQP